MDLNLLKELLLEVKDGRLDIDTALERLKVLPYEDLGYARLEGIKKGIP